MKHRICLPVIIFVLIAGTLPADKPDKKEEIWKDFSFVDMHLVDKKKEYAARAALNECEKNRLNPTNEVQGLRKIMTHCRIHQFKLIE